MNADTFIHKSTSLYHGDSLVVLDSLEESSIDTVITDPPYNIGFMNKSWDKRGVAFDPETWKKVLRVAKPGAFLLCFGGTRTYHRIACAIEDAGWEIRDCCMWMYSCLSEDTEVLTNKGWVRYHKNIEDDLVLTVNIESNEFCFDKPLRSFIYENAHPAYRISSDHTDQIVSRNHCCIVERGGRNVFAYAETLKHQESVPFLESLHDLPEAIPSTQQCTSYKKQVLLDAVCSQEAQEKEIDASAHRHDRNSLCCLQKESMESQMLGEKNSRSNLFIQLQRYFAREGFGKASSWWRKIRSFLLDTEIKRRSCKENDGINKSCLERRGDIFSQAWELFTNKIRALSQKVFEYVSQGWLCNGTSVVVGSAYWQMSYSGRSGSSHRPRSYEQQNIKSDAVPFQSGTQNIRRTTAKVEEIEYVGKMWCIETRLGAFVARRNGKIFITGNSGFPKSLDISKAMDKSAGAERKVIGVKRNTYDGASRDPSKHGNPADQSSMGKWGLKQTPHGMPLTNPATEEAKQWEGWGTSLKPAWEPIIIAMKPLDKNFAHNALQHGVAGLHIDAGRVGYQNESDKDLATPQGKCTSKEVSAIGAEPDAGRELERVEFERPKQAGRWPANCMLSHSVDCKFMGHRKVRNKSGSVSGDEPSHTGDENTTCYGKYKRVPFKKHGEAGIEEMEYWECSPECPVRLLDEQSGTVSFGSKPGGYKYSDKEYDVKGFVGKCKPQSPSNYGDLGGASRFFYVSKVSKKERNLGLPKDLQNSHPTVKPIKLMEYLCALTETPTKGTVLDPFMGSGSTGVACAQTGRSFIGIELEKDSFEISRLRILHAYNKKRRKPIDLFGDDDG